MSRQGEYSDPMARLIDKITETLLGDGPHQPPQFPRSGPGGPEHPEGLEGTLREVAAVIDSVDGRLLDIERSLATAQELSEANAPDVSAQLREAHGLLLKLTENLPHHAEAGLPPASSSETPTDSGARSAPAQDDAEFWDQEVRSFLDRLDEWILPKPTGRPAGGSPAADRALILCKALADLAKVLALLADVVTGSISLSVQKVAEGLRAPLVATGVELSLAAAKEMAGGEPHPKLTEQLCADAILGFAGSPELKATAFVLRLTGVVTCLAAGVRLTELHTQCPCCPDLLSDAGSAVIGS